MSLLAVNQLSISAGETPLVKNLSLTVKAGEIVVVIGPNGAGKSTLLNAIAGNSNTLKDNAGDISFYGTPLAQWPARLKARHMALLPQQSSLNFPFTVEEVVNLARFPHDSGRRVDREIIHEALNLLDISHLKPRLYTQLSGGERQRVQLARVMAQIWRSEDAEPRLLLLDEPTASLDLGHQQQLMQALKEFSRQGVAIVMVAHDINLISPYADRMLALYGGESLGVDTPEHLLSAALIKQLYQVEVTLVKHPDSGKPVIAFADAKVV
ncbi:MAG: iron complex transport system ATP-binding protein [Cellvibrionaceae bacterium]|jgi:iron complex transport system ATP-binding protein